MSILRVDQHFRLLQRIYIGANAHIANVIEQRQKRGPYNMKVFSGRGSGTISKTCQHCHVAFNGAKELEECPFCYRLT